MEFSVTILNLLNIFFLNQNKSIGLSIFRQFTMTSICTSGLAMGRCLLPNSKSVYRRWKWTNSLPSSRVVMVWISISPLKMTRPMDVRTSSRLEWSRTVGWESVWPSTSTWKATRWSATPLFRTTKFRCLKKWSNSCRRISWTCSPFISSIDWWKVKPGSKLKTERLRSFSIENKYCYTLFILLFDTKHISLSLSHIYHGFPRLILGCTETVTIVPSKMLLPCISKGKTSRDKGIVTVSVQTANTDFEERHLRTVSVGLSLFSIPANYLHRTNYMNLFVVPMIVLRWRFSTSVLVWELYLSHKHFINFITELGVSTLHQTDTLSIQFNISTFEKHLC